MENSSAHQTNGRKCTNGCVTDANNATFTEMVRKRGTLSSGVIDDLSDWAEEFGCHVEDLEFARAMDCRDPLRRLRSEFIFPKIQDLPGGKLN